MTPVQRRLLNKIARYPGGWQMELSLWGANVKTAEQLEDLGYLISLPVPECISDKHPHAKTFQITSSGQTQSHWKTI